MEKWSKTARKNSKKLTLEPRFALARLPEQLAQWKFQGIIFDRKGTKLIKLEM